MVGYGEQAGFGNQAGPVMVVGLVFSGSSPVHVHSTVEKGGSDHRVAGNAGMARTYASVISDMRYDVNLVYAPLLCVDGIAKVVLNDSDCVEDVWNGSLVGYFLQGTLPFGTVRAIVMGLWKS
ncbi:hypothetical protein Dimus_033496 [Dionaea muscipula]